MTIEGRGELGKTGTLVPDESLHFWTQIDQWLSPFLVFLLFGCFVEVYILHLCILRYPYLLQTPGGLTFAGCRDNSLLNSTYCTFNGSGQQTG